jgi:adenosylmethionine-8-amino-7-oxononanoate aminotransferase
MARSPILHRQPGRDLPMAVAGDGPYIVDAAGRRYLDACGGAAVSCLGHSERRVTEAVAAQLERLAYTHTSFFTSEPAEELADRLAAGAPPELGNVYLVSGGSEAVETALKLARQYFVERGEPERTRFVARRQSYHGNTLGALAVGGNAGRRAIYEPMLVPASHVDPCFEYRFRLPGESAEAYGERAAQYLEAELERVGPRTVAAFVAETVVGATAGAVPPAPGYFRRIREICDRHGVLLILDEVMCGMGRTGTMHAFEQEGIVPDIVTLAKGLGAGYLPIGACLVATRVRDAIEAGSGAFRHGFTYVGHAAACAGALAVQKVIEEDDLVRRCAIMGGRLADALRAAFADHPHVGDIRGRGLLLALEFVSERQAKRPFEPAQGVAGRIRDAAMREGLLVYPGTGTADGARGDHILLAPAFIIGDDHVAAIVERLVRAIDAVLPAGRHGG